MAINSEGESRPASINSAGMPENSQKLQEHATIPGSSDTQRKCNPKLKDLNRVKGFLADAANDVKLLMQTMDYRNEAERRQAAENLKKLEQIIIQKSEPKKRQAPHSTKCGSSQNGKQAETHKELSPSALELQALQHTLTFRQYTLLMKRQSESQLENPAEVKRPVNQGGCHKKSTKSHNRPQKQRSTRPKEDWGSQFEPTKVKQRSPKEEGKIVPAKRKLESQVTHQRQSPSLLVQALSHAAGSNKGVNLTKDRSKGSGVPQAADRLCNYNNRGTEISTTFGREEVKSQIIPTRDSLNENKSLQVLIKKFQATVSKYNAFLKEHKLKAPSPAIPPPNLLNDPQLGRVAGVLLRNTLEQTLLSDAGAPTQSANQSPSSELEQSIKELIALCKNYTSLYQVELRRSREVAGLDETILQRAKERMEGYRQQIRALKSIVKKLINKNGEVYYDEQRKKKRDQKWLGKRANNLNSTEHHIIAAPAFQSGTLRSGFLEQSLSLVCEERIEEAAAADEGQVAAGSIIQQETLLPPTFKSSIGSFNLFTHGLHNPERGSYTSVFHTTNISPQCHQDTHMRDTLDESCDYPAIGASDHSSNSHLNLSGGPLTPKFSSQLSQTTYDAANPQQFGEESTRLGTNYSNESCVGKEVTGREVMGSLIQVQAQASSMKQAYYSVGAPSTSLSHASNDLEEEQGRDECFLIETSTSENHLLRRNKQETDSLHLLPGGTSPTTSFVDSPITPPLKSTLTTITPQAGKPAVALYRLLGRTDDQELQTPKM
ncbi:hypothetical protein FGO68_gene10110 [Halteria grandinella]|uniref:Uncharacterized protein n=1 Tax=Halteria grandinella TaxID=5974 RepID=A0A8J8T769_HALGN|nr:hypothetical protein FGO68_gene10110 [Halteria grandinella]